MDGEANLFQGDELARADALDVTRSFIVQAPAGSGKTELLIQRYLKLLATVDQPEEVVAITFTIKAAQEMRLRALSAMRAAQRNEAPGAAHEQVTRQAAIRVLERDAGQGWNLLESPRRMRIRTMDALNASIARALPFSSGLGRAGRIGTDDEMQQLYKRAAAATLDWLLTEGPGNDAVEQVLVHLDNNTSLYIGYLARMLATRDQWLPITGAGSGQPDETVRRRLERNIAAQVSTRLARIRQRLPEERLRLLADLCRYAGRNLLPEGRDSAHLLAECRQFPAADAGQVGVWRAIADLLLTKSGSFRARVDRNVGFPPKDRGEKQEMQELLRLLAEQPDLAAELHAIRQLPDPRYTDQQWSVLLALFRLLPLAATELLRLFADLGITDYTQVAAAAAEALGDEDEPGDIGLLLDYTIRHLLIDEMQDTSLAQYRLVERLVRGWEEGDGRTLFCVGDPMQSIYRFRDAEVGQFLLARERGIGAVKLQPLVLRRNFRSGERLVQWFNAVFEQVLPPEDDISVGAITYAASVPVDTRHGEGECHVHPLFGASPEEEAEYALEVIRRCTAHPDGCTTAVLVQARRQLPLLLARLRSAGIDYQAVEIDRLTDLPEIIDLLALTRAIAHRGDRIAWLGLLRGPWVGLGWGDMHRLVFNDRSGTVWELLHDDAVLAAVSADARAELLRFRETMRPFITGHGTASLRETVERAWYLLRGPLLLQNREEAANAYRFLEILEGLDTAGTLADVAELEARLDQERVSGNAAPDCRLHIMTMHKAKGLEFDHVVLFGLGRTTKGDDKAILSWLNLPDGAGGSSMIISPAGARAEIENDPLHSFIEKQEREKERFEQERLLYVACTRARRSLHLVGHVGRKGDGTEMGDPPQRTLLYSLWPAVKEIFAERFAGDLAAAQREEPEEAAEWPLPPLRRLHPGAELAPPPLPPVAAATRASPVSGQAVDYHWVGAAARHAGTILHRWLHRIATGELRVDIQDTGRLMPVAHRSARELGVPAHELEAVCERCVRALRGILEDEKGRWILSGEGLAEFPVTGLWQDRIESIVIDRVRVDDRGVHWIIDYKASTHEGGGLDVFLEQEAARYRPQLAKYAYLYRNLLAQPVPEVRTALYFPLLRQFREVATA